MELAIGLPEQPQNSAAGRPICPVSDLVEREPRNGADLGGVDKVPDPQSDGCDEDEAEEAVGGLVVSGGQSSALFEL